MTVGELIDQLKVLDPEMEVRIAMQPNWPLQLQVGEVITITPDNIKAELEIVQDDDGWYIDEGGDGYVDGPFEFISQAEKRVDEIANEEANDRKTLSCVWIADGGQIYDNPYLPGIVSKLLGWK